MKRNHPGNDAIVIGGSLIGMLAARVLSEHFRSVRIIERDKPPVGPFPRQGSPQGAHVHVLLDKGRTIISRFFPGIFEDLKAAGALEADSVRDLAWHHGGVWKARGESGVNFFMQSRPLVDWVVRTRLLRDCPNVKIENELEVDSLIHEASSDRITGVRVRPRGRPNPRKELIEMPCELLVDAAGRGSRMPRWLRDMGYDEPVEEKHTVNIGYTTRLYEQAPPSDRDWSAMMIYARAPQKKLGYIYPVEPDASGKQRWIVTMAGALGDHAPATETGFMEHARCLPRPDIYDWIQKGRPLSKFWVFKFPATRRLRYDRCRRLPEGFVAVGDSLASFNPIYGQGMSIGAGAVALLEKLLRRGNHKGLQHRFFRQAYWKVIFIPWMLVTSEDYRHKETPGKRPFGLPLLHWYTSRVNQLAGQDSRIAAEFLKVLHFINTPAALFQPYVLLRVIASALGLYRTKVPYPEREMMRLPPGSSLQSKLRQSREAAAPAKRRPSRATKKRSRSTSTTARARSGKKKTARKTAASGRKKTTGTRRTASAAGGARKSRAKSRV